MGICRFCSADNFGNDGVDAGGGDVKDVDSLRLVEIEDLRGRLLPVEDILKLVLRHLVIVSHHFLWLKV